MTGIKDLGELTARVSERAADAANLGTAAQIADAAAKATPAVDLPALETQLQDRLTAAAALGTRVVVADSANNAVAAFVVAAGGTYTPGVAT